MGCRCSISTDIMGKGAAARPARVDSQRFTHTFGWFASQLHGAREMRHCGVVGEISNLFFCRQEKNDPITLGTGSACFHHCDSLVRLIALLLSSCFDSERQSQ